MSEAEPVLEGSLPVERLQRIYDATAAFYDGVVANQQAAAKLQALALLARQPGERLLEVGCGTGWTLSRIIVASGADQLWGVDLAPGMITVARQRLQREAGLAQTPLLLADARHLPCPDASFDCLLSTYTLEVLPLDAMAAVLGECRRVLRPGGRLVLANLTEGQGADAAMTDDWKRRFRSDPEAFGGARPLLATPMLTAAGFSVVSRAYSGPDWPSELLLARRP